MTKQKTPSRSGPTACGPRSDTPTACGGGKGGADHKERGRTTLTSQELLPPSPPVNEGCKASSLNNFAKKRAEFVAGTATLDRLPEMTLPEIAFAGRSNVGKSSLINALTQRRDLARTSVTPGRTQQLNFFNIDDTFLLVDMPGYGYAKASKKAVAMWNKLVRQYLAGRASLKRVFVLIDSRRGIMDVDLQTMGMLDEAAVSYQLVLTKCDKVKTTEFEKMFAETIATSKKHVACHPEILTTSAHENEGLDALRAAVLFATTGS